MDQVTDKHTVIFGGVDGLAIKTTNCGAALSSISVRNTEYMGEWPSSTGGMTSGFVMAPVVGSVSESGKFLHGGAIYEPGKHGYARKTQFSRAITGNCVSFEHTHDPVAQTGIYPSPHKIKLDYLLAANEVTMVMRVENVSDRDMRFGCGLHPAFHWPLPGNSEKAGHVLRLLDRLPEGTVIYRPVDGKVRENAVANNPFNQTGAWHIGNNDFLNDAYFFLFPTNVKGAAQRLVLSNGQSSLTFSMKGWDGFGVWSKPGVNNRFICIEPFAGVPVIAKADDAVPHLEDIKGLKTLPARSTFSASMNIAIEPR